MTGGASEPVRRLLDRLERVRRSGDGWTARCPAHDDDTPSLSISEGDDGRALVNCHAGCSTEEVVAALAMKVADLFPDDGARPGQGGYTVEEYAAYLKLPAAFLRSEFSVGTHRNTGKASTVAIPYRDTSGETVRTRHRMADRFWWGHDGDGMTLYGVDRLVEADPSREVLLVEGESDVHTLAFHGVLGVGVPGASSWRSSWAGHLEGRAVCLWREPDRGGDMLAAAVSADLPQARVIEAPADAEDPAELHRVAGDEFRERLGELTEAAKPISEVVDGVTTSETPDDAPSVPLGVLYDALEGTALEYDLKPYTAQSRLTLLSAPPKRGKSTFVALYAHAKATGGTFIGQELAPGRVLYVAPDENWRDVVRRFRAFGTPGHRLEVWRGRNLSITRIAARADEIGADLIVLDTLLRVAGISDENDNAEWDRWFGEARDHIHDSGAVWFAVHHDRKSGGTDGEGIRGASAIFGCVDVAISLQKSDESPHRRILRVEGSRLDGAEPLVVELDAEASLYRAVGEQRIVTVLEDAALERLRAVLSETPQPVSDIYKVLCRRFSEAEEDVAESTIRKRLERLRSAGLADREGDGGRRDPYRYFLTHSPPTDRDEVSVRGHTHTSSQKGEDTSEREPYFNGTHGDTRSPGKTHSVPHFFPTPRGETSERDRPRPSETGSDTPATRAQVERIEALAGDDAQAWRLVRETATTPQELTQGDAADLIEKLEQLVRMEGADS